MSPATFPMLTLALGAVEPAGPANTAVQFEHLFLGLMLFGSLVTLIVMVLVVAYVIKYHAGSPADRGHTTHHAHSIETVWIIAFTLIGLGLFIWAARDFYDLKNPPANATAIYVVGKQWMWKIRHEDGREEINELHVPTGQPVKLVMTSQDVIHSFFIPAFRVKQDVLPDRYTTLWFEATTPGTYRIFCAEYCGASHSEMIGYVIAMQPGNFEKWLGPAPADLRQTPGTPGTPQAAMALGLNNTFSKLGCIACHVPDDAVRAPQLAGIYDRPVRLQNGQTVVADEAYIRESILKPNAKISAGYPSPSLMPSYQGQITEAQMQDLIGFIKSLRDGWPRGAKQETSP